MRHGQYKVSRTHVFHILKARDNDELCSGTYLKSNSKRKDKMTTEMLLKTRNATVLLTFKPQESETGSHLPHRAPLSSPLP